MLKLRETTLLWRKVVKVVLSVEESKSSTSKKPTFKESNSIFASSSNSKLFEKNPMEILSIPITVSLSIQVNAFPFFLSCFVSQQNIPYLVVFLSTLSPIHSPQGFRFYLLHLYLFPSKSSHTVQYQFLPDLSNLPESK